MTDGPETPALAPAPGAGSGPRAPTCTLPGMATPEDLFARLAALGIATETHAHRPVFTVEESRALRTALPLPGAHCKTLFLKDRKGALFLCVVEETRRMDIRALADQLGAARLSFASPDRVRTHLGIEPGAVTPFALINDPGAAIAVVLDADVMAAPLANFHPLVNDRTTAIRPTDLDRFVRSCGHMPRILDLGPATAA